MYRHREVVDELEESQDDPPATNEQASLLRANRARQSTEEMERTGTDFANSKKLLVDEVSQSADQSPPSTNKKKKKGKKQPRLDQVSAQSAVPSPE